MPEDASLDAFVSSDAAETEDEDDPELGGSDAVEPEDADTTRPPSEPADSEPSGDSAEDPESAVASDVDPAVSTYDWSPESGECADCGTPVERRWRGEGQRDGALVCADCKEW